MKNILLFHVSLHGSVEVMNDLKWIINILRGMMDAMKGPKCLILIKEMHNKKEMRVFFIALKEYMLLLHIS